MANLSSIARPYALAAFEIARDSQQLPAWKDLLVFAAQISQHKDVVKLLANPDVSSAKLFEFFHEMLASKLTPKNTEQENFLRLLAQNKRFNVLAEISQAFNALYASLEKMSRVRVITAVKAGQEFQQKLSSSLTKRIKNEVTLECEIDPAIIGGAIIHMGDRVIDGSIRGQLARLLNNLTA